MFDSFTKEKSDFLKKRDKSKKGSVDIDIKKLVNEINSKKDHYTTSSCAGRIVLLEKLSKKKNETRWIFLKHNKITLNEIIQSLKKYQNKNEIWFKQEPIILHVRCRNVDAANRFLDAARKIFKRAGIISLSEKKIIIEVIGSERVDTIIKVNNIMPDKRYLKELIKIANKNFVENKRKSEGLLKIIQKV